MSKFWLALVAIALVGLSLAFYASRVEGRYLLLESWTYVRGEALEGGPRELMIDFPTYRLDEESGVLVSYRPLSLNSSVKLIVGEGTSLSGDVGSGVSSQIVGIYNLPADLNDYVRIVSVSDDDVVLRLAGEEVTLSPGESREQTWEYIETWAGGKMRIVKTIRVTNKGYVRVQIGG